MSNKLGDGGGAYAILWNFPTLEAYWDPSFSNSNILNLGKYLYQEFTENLVLWHPNMGLFLDYSKS